MYDYRPDDGLPAFVFSPGRVSFFDYWCNWANAQGIRGMGYLCTELDAGLTGIRTFSRVGLCVKDKRGAGFCLGPPTWATLGYVNILELGRRC